MAKGEKKKSKWWIVVVVLVVIGIAASSGDSEDKDENPQKVASSSDVKEDGEHKKTDDDSKSDEAEAEEDETVKTTFVKGDVLETEDLKISYLDCGKYTDYNEYWGPSEGNKIVFLEFEFENISDSDQYVSTFEFSCYADGYDCESYFGNEESLDATLSVGKKTKGKVMFEVPKDAKEVQVEYEVNFWKSDKIVFEVEH